MYRRSGRGRLLLIAFLILSIVVITLDFRRNPGGPIERAKDITAAIVAPVQRGFSRVARPVGDFFSALGDLSDLRSQNERLEAELDALEQQVERSEGLVDENEELRRTLDLKATWLSMDTIAAEVISNTPSNYKWGIVIDKGRAEGVQTNMAVIAPEGLVGRVVRADTHTATVLLLIDPESGAAARVHERGVIGAITGNGSDRPLSLEFTGKDPHIVEGDLVVTSGYDGGIFPASIPIGTIEDIDIEGAALSPDVEVEPVVDFRDLRFVQVLLDTGKELASSRTKDGD